VKEEFRILTCNPRGAGVAYRLAEAVSKFKDGCLVCSDLNEARRVSKQYGIKTVSVREDLDKYRGLGDVKLWEPSAIDYLISKYENEIFELQYKIQPHQQYNKKFERPELVVHLCSGKHWKFSEFEDRREVQ